MRNFLLRQKNRVRLEMGLIAVGVPATLAVGFAVALGSSSASLAGAARGAVTMAPHRAVYDITLVQASSGSGISDMTGRMVYELSGSACDGYTQKMRFVTQITDRNGSAQINDMRSSTWEDGSAERMRFDLSQYRNERLTDSTQGDAGRKRVGKDAVSVRLTKPQSKGFNLTHDVYFPIQHSIALIEAARDGQNLLTAKIYDGSEKGEKVYLTSAFIGKQFSSGTRLIPASVNKELSNKVLPAWPVSISFFGADSGRVDEVPEYELSFRFIENGISTQLLMDYGDFAVRGDLSELSLLSAPACNDAGTLD